MLFVDAKEKHADILAIQSFLEYNAIRCHYPKLEEVGIAVDSDWVGSVLVRKRSPQIRQWAPRYPHPWGDLSETPCASYPNDSLTKKL